MRISLFTEVFPPKIDGITNRLRHTLRCLSLDGHDLQVFAPGGADETFPYAEVVPVPAVPFSPYPGLMAGLPDPRIGRGLLRFAPDVVHVVGPVCLGVWGTIAASSQALPIVSSYHTDLPGYLEGYGLGWARPVVWPLLRLVHNQAHVNLTPSDPTRQELQGHGVRNVGLWRGGVDTELFHPRMRSLAMRERLTEGRPDAPLLLYAGRLAPEKGLDVFERLLDALPEARVALVGDGPARQDLERRFRDRPVHVTGFLEGEELATAFASADVFVMPSTTETLGFVALEAMASGLPVVAADAGGLTEIVHHEDNGLLFDPSDPLQAASHVARMLESRPLRRHLAERGRKAAENQTWQSETRRLVAHYDKARALARRTISGRLRRLLV